MEKVKPFVKWAGGKGNLINQLIEYYPKEVKDGVIQKYVEPFVGGGAVLIHILQNYNIKEAYAFDINTDLINCYNSIKLNVNELINELKKIENEYISLEDSDREKYYYKTRGEYNSYFLEENIDIKRASQFIFLNRTCYNGLYRVNKSGKFNVPYGKYVHPTICDEENLRGLSLLFKNVKFICADYKKSKEIIDDSTFTYFDPPYRPLSITSGFTSYTKECFSEKDQIELAKYYSELDKYGSKLMLSNSDPKNVDLNDNFFEKNYEGFNIHSIYAKRMINCNENGRGNISELVITNY